MKLKGQRRGESGGNYVDMETGKSFWVSGVKKNGEGRHWVGSGKVLVEAAALSDYLKVIGAKTLDNSRCEVTNTIRQTDVERLSRLGNASGKGGPLTLNRHAILTRFCLTCLAVNSAKYIPLKMAGAGSFEMG